MEQQKRCGTTLPISLHASLTNQSRARSIEKQLVNHVVEPHHMETSSLPSNTPSHKHTMFSLSVRHSNVFFTVAVHAQPLMLAMIPVTAHKQSSCYYHGHFSLVDTERTNRQKQAARTDVIIMTSK